jgi:hypothetical protein
MNIVNLNNIACISTISVPIAALFFVSFLQMSASIIVKRFGINTFDESFDLKKEIDLTH